MSLRPVWQVVTDVDTMLVDGLSGALSTKEEEPLDCLQKLQQSSGFLIR